MVDKNIDSCHLMMHVYCGNGMGDAVCLFEEMMKHGLKPNEETSLIVFMACVAVGGVKQKRFLAYKDVSMIARESRILEFPNLTYYKDESNEMAIKKGAVYAGHKVCYA